MRHHIDQCVRTISGFQGTFGPEMEAYWRDVEVLYKNCNVLQIPQEHIPLWWVRALDKQIPLKKPGFEKLKSTLPERKPSEHPIGA